LHLLFVTSELAPLAQTGGLGDAVAGLAKALAARGHRVDCALPAYPAALDHPLAPRLDASDGVRFETSSGTIEGRWRTGRLGELNLHLFDVAGLYDRPGLYGGADEGFRFAVFARAAAARAATLLPDVVVAHDWQAALSLCVLRTLHDHGRARGIGTVQAVHNNAHQGRYAMDLIGATGLPGELLAPDGLECYGALSLLKGGLGWADRIVAVSPRYAKELRTPEFGEGLEGLYQFRAHRLTGIANGIDTDAWNPADDDSLVARFDRSTPAERASCRAALLDELGLDAPEPGRLLASVGRFAVQKGWDVLESAIPDLVRAGACLVLLGDGDPAIVERLATLVQRWPDRVALRIGWNEKLARRIYAGADSVLVPSRFEPCGLVQLLAQRYGALPIAHAVGGLTDTIRDGKTGILFSPLSAPALCQAVERGAALWREDPVGLHRRLLRKDVSWKKPAARWEETLALVATEGANRL